MCETAVLRAVVGRALSPAALAHWRRAEYLLRGVDLALGVLLQLSHDIAPQVRILS